VHGGRRDARELGGCTLHVFPESTTSRIASAISDDQQIRRDDDQQIRRDAREIGGCIACLCQIHNQQIRSNTSAKEIDHESGDSGSGFYSNTASRHDVYGRNNQRFAHLIGSQSTSLSIITLSVDLP
jgi:hypothetical protein